MHIYFFFPLKIKVCSLLACNYARNILLHYFNTPEINLVLLINPWTLHSWAENLKNKMRSCGTESIWLKSKRTCILRAPALSKELPISPLRSISGPGLDFFACLVGVLCINYLIRVVPLEPVQGKLSQKLIMEPGIVFG